MSGAVPQDGALSWDDRLAAEMDALRRDLASGAVDDPRTRAYFRRTWGAGPPRPSVRGAAGALARLSPPALVLPPVVVIAVAAWWCLTRKPAAHDIAAPAVVTAAVLIVWLVSAMVVTVISTRRWRLRPVTSTGRFVVARTWPAAEHLRHLARTESQYAWVRQPVSVLLADVERLVDTLDATYLAWATDRAGDGENGGRPDLVQQLSTTLLIRAGALRVAARSAAMQPLPVPHPEFAGTGLTPDDALQALRPLAPDAPPDPAPTSAHRCAFRRHRTHIS